MTGPLVQNNVLIGEDGWLYLYGGGHKEFDHFLNKRQPTPASVANFVDNFQARQQYCNARGIGFAHFVLPSKPAVMPEHVPSPYRQGLDSLFERHFRPAFGDKTPANLRYSRDALLAAKDMAPVFLKTDTHNNAFGALHIAKDILRHFDLPSDIEDFFFQREGWALGDLSIMLGRQDREPILHLEEKHNHIKVFDNLPFLSSNTGNVLVMNNLASVTTKRCVVIGDSFIKSGLRYLGMVFRDILYVRGPYFQSDVIELFGPDFVLCSNTERYLATVMPDRDGHSLMLATYGDQTYKPTPELVDAFKAQLSFVHHPQRYAEWTGRFHDDTMKWPGLGDCLLRHIAVIDKSKGSFEALTQTPRMIFDHLPMPAEGAVKVELSITVAEASTLRLFYSGKTNDERHFSSARSLTRQLGAGANLVQFQLDAKACGRRMRIDPVNQSGAFTIERISIQPV